MTIGFFTEGIALTLPHPKISQRTIMLLCKVIERAWQLLKEHPPTEFDLQTADEDTITHLLVEIIENRLRMNGEIGGFDYAMFGRATREHVVTNYDKRHINKRPDIFFDLKRDKLPVLSDQDGLFVECKPVDSSHTVLSCYCNKGLVRFVDGDYAWAMQDALMVGYVKKPYTFTKFSAALDNQNNNIDLKTIAHSESTQGLYRSRHKRTFNWLERHGQACPIEVSHLWLPV